MIGAEEPELGQPGGPGRPTAAPPDGAGRAASPDREAAESSEPSAPGGARSALDRLHLVGLLATLLVAAALRLADLDRFPPGLHYDEAAYGVLARDTLVQGAPKLFYRDFAGREPLFIWLTAGAIALVGETPLALRLTAALVGVASVAATYLAGRALLGRWAGLAGAAAYAVAFWPVLVARLGYRANTPPLVEALATFLLWRALARPGAGRFLLAGAATGLILYTYVAARFAFVGLAAFFALQLVVDRRRLLARWRGLALYAGAALAVMAPLLAYFAADPAAFTIRFDQTIALNRGDDGVSALLGSTLRTLGAFSFAGDPLWKENLPGRPIFDPVGALLFYLGVGAALWRWREPGRALLLLWGLAMLLPGALTAEAPHFLRLVGAAPPIFLLAGLGATTLVRRLAALQRRPAGGPGAEGAATSARPVTPLGLPLAPLAAALGVVVWLGWSAQRTADDYFRRWAPSAEAYFAQEGDVADAARAVRSRLAAGDSAPVYFSAVHYRHPSVAYLTGPFYESLKWIDGRFDVVLPADGGPATYVLPASTRSDLLQRCLSGAERTERGLAPDGQVAFEVWRWPGGAPACQPANPLGARLGDLVELLGYDLPPSGRPGEPLEVVLFWRILARPERATEIFVHLVDGRGLTWGSADGIQYLHPEWAPGEVVVSRRPLVIDRTAPPGSYRVEFGFFDRASLRRLPRLDERGNPTGDTLVSGPVRVERAGQPPAEADLPLTARVAARFGDLELLGYRAESLAARQGEALRIGLFWRAAGPLDDLQVRLSLARGEQVVAAWAAAPVDGAYPTSAWAPGEIVRDERDLPLGARLPPGQYDLLVEVLASDGSPAGPGPVRLGSAAVLGRDRLAEPPAVAHRQEAQFGGLARLVGYDLVTERAVAGGEVGLTLYWQAMAEGDARYKVFTHLIDASDRIWGQQDAEPGGGAQPTSSWIAGEYVVDRYRIPIDPATPPATYRLEVGLYDPDSGQRLLLPDGSSRLLLDEPIVVR